MRSVYFLGIFSFLKCKNSKCKVCKRRVWNFIYFWHLALIEYLRGKYCFIFNKSIKTIVISLNSHPCLEYYLEKSLMFVLDPQYHPTSPLFLKIYFTQKKYYLSPNRQSCHIIFSNKRYIFIELKKMFIIKEIMLF